jgi:anti-sigma factor RsiW
MSIRTCHVQASGAIELLFYGELGESERRMVERHLTACADCRSALDELGLIRAALAARPDVDGPPGGDWSGFMSRLDLAIRQAEAPAGAPSVTRQGAAQSQASRPHVPLLAMAALIALVTLSVVALVRWRGQETTDTGIASIGLADPEPTIAAGVPSRDAFAALSEQHLERSKLVVLKLANEDDTGGDLTYERRLASTLLSDTRLYRLTAEERGMTSLARVMGDLELVLLQTSMSEGLDAGGVEQIQRLIHKRDLVTRMNAMVLAGGM